MAAKNAHKSAIRELVISAANDRFQQAPTASAADAILSSLTLSVLRGLVDLNGDDATDLTAGACKRMLMATRTFKASDAPESAVEITGIEIRTADVEWIERTGFDWREDYVTNSRYYLVTVPASAMVNVERVTFAGRDMVRGTITGTGPNDHNPNVLYPLGYAKIRHSVEK